MEVSLSFEKMNFIKLMKLRKARVRARRSRRCPAAGCSRTHHLLLLP